MDMAQGPSPGLLACYACSLIAFSRPESVCLSGASQAISRVFDILTSLLNLLIHQNTHTHPLDTSNQASDIFHPLANPTMIVPIHAYRFTPSY